jgi:uncharacterized protein (DUF1800 family)
MWEDPIVAEVRQVREAYAKKHDYNLRAMYRDLKAKENAEPGEKASLSPKLIQTEEQMPIRLRPANSTA